MWQIFLLLWKIILKIVILGHSEIPQDCTISIKKIGGGGGAYPRTPLPPGINLNPHHYRAIYVPGM